MAQNITLLGASYSAVPAVMLPKTGGGNALFADPSPVTAVAADVTQGKYFIDSNGDLVEGTAGGGGQRTTIVPEQTVTVSSSSTQIQYIQPLVLGEDYIYTINGVEYTGTAWNDGVVALGTDSTTGEIGYHTGSGVMYFFVASSSQYGTYTVKVEQESGGGGSTLIEKAITANGTYNASDDSADGYSKVTVNVSGGSVNIGTVTTTNSSNQNTSIDFTLPSGRTPKAFFCRLTSQIARNSNSRYYYVYDMRWDGSSTGGVEGNTFYMSSGTLTNVTSGYSKSQSGTTFTLSSTGSRSASPGSFFNGTYELVYVY